MKRGRVAAVMTDGEQVSEPEVKELIAALVYWKLHSFGARKLRVKKLIRMLGRGLYE